MKRIIKIILVLLSFFLCSCNLALLPSAGDTTESGNFIGGGLTDASDIPLKDVKVLLYQENALLVKKSSSLSSRYVLVQTVKTNSAGKYNFVVSTEGVYQLKAEYENKIYIIREHIDYNPDEGFDVGDEVITSLKEYQSQSVSFK